MLYMDNPVLFVFLILHLKLAAGLMLLLTGIIFDSVMFEMFEL